MTVKTDKQRLTDVFRSLRKQGFKARQNFMCCQNCGWSAMENQYDIQDNDDVVFYHNQDNDSFGDDKNLEETLYLAWDGKNPQIIVDTLKEHGFKVKWDGSTGKRIGVINEAIYQRSVEQYMEVQLA